MNRGLLETDLIVKDAYIKSIHGDWNALQDIKVLNQVGLFWIYQVASEAILTNLTNYYQFKEKYVHVWFKKNLKKLLGKDYELAIVRSNRKHQPDVWVKKNGENIPVECKLGDFDKKALKQIQRYMDFYSAKEGIAVAKNLKCELPQNVLFIKYEVED